MFTGAVGVFPSLENATRQIDTDSHESATRRNRRREKVSAKFLIAERFPVENNNCRFSDSRILKKIRPLPSHPRSKIYKKNKTPPMSTTALLLTSSPTVVFFTSLIVNVLRRELFSKIERSQFVDTAAAASFLAHGVRALSVSVVFLSLSHAEHVTGRRDGARDEGRGRGYEGARVRPFERGPGVINVWQTRAEMKFRSSKTFPNRLPTPAITLCDPL